MLSGTVESVMNGTRRGALPRTAPALPSRSGDVGRRAARRWGSIRRDRIALEKVPPGAKPRRGLNTVVGEVHTHREPGLVCEGDARTLGDGEEFVAHLLDESFFANPLDIGDRVVARWSASDIKLLDDGTVAHEMAAAGTAVATAG